MSPAEIIQLRPETAPDPIISFTEITTLDGSPVAKRFRLENGELKSKVAAHVCHATAREDAAKTTPDADPR